MCWFCFLFYFLFCFIFFTAKCTPYDIGTAATSTTAQIITWKCHDFTKTNEFTVKYTLTNKDHCNAPDEYLNVQNEVPCSSCNRAETDIGDVYSYHQDLSALQPHSIYSYSIQSLGGTSSIAYSFTTGATGEWYASKFHFTSIMYTNMGNINGQSFHVMVHLKQMNVLNVIMTQFWNNASLVISIWFSVRKYGTRFSEQHLFKILNFLWSK